MQKAEISMSSEEFGRLPKKARDEITRHVNSYNFLIAQLDKKRKQAETSVWYRDALDTHDEKTYLPEGTRVFFKTKDGGVIEVSARPEGVNARTSDGRVVVYPNVSNSIYLEQEPHR